MKNAAEFEMAKGAPVRVLVADPSAVVRTAVKRMLEFDGAAQVVGTAQGGEEVLQKAIATNPDVVVLDIEMNQVSGLAVLREISRRCPRPVIMLSRATADAAEETLQALDEGAFDYVPKQFTGDARELGRLRHELVSKVRAALRAARRRRPRPMPAGSIARITGTEAAGNAAEGAASVICVGSSTGGPRALQQILPALPPDLPAGVLVVQHMPAGFTEPFARRLNSMCALQVREASAADAIEQGTVLIAPAGWHMLAQRRGQSGATVELSRLPEDVMHRPSVDVLMTSVAKIFRAASMGIILTGMGTDGAQGMQAIYSAGGMTVGQDEASCAVYGMPRSCAEMGVLRRMVPLEAIKEEILAATGHKLR